MTTWNRVQGDTNDVLTGEVGGIDSLVGIGAVVAHIWRTGVAPVTLTCAIVDAPNRVVRVLLGDWITTAEPAVWSVEVQATGLWSDGTTGPRTFPARGCQFLRVRAQGA